MHSRVTDQLSSLLISSGCGLSNKRIIGGEEARENEFPWMCSVLYSDSEVGKNNLKIGI